VLDSKLARSRHGGRHAGGSAGIFAGLRPGLQGLRELARWNAFLSATSRGDVGAADGVNVWLGTAVVLFFDHGDGSV
jgi:hypothetical protein